MDVGFAAGGREERDAPCERKAAIVYGFYPSEFPGIPFLSRTNPSQGRPRKVLPK